MTDGYCFISYSAADGLDFAAKLADELQGRHPFIKVWFDKRELDASIVDWDDQLANAIKGCKCLIFVMTPDSTAKGSTCKDEWTWALKYKKPVICLLKDKKAEVPFRLANRQYIDISTDFDSGIAQLRSAIQRLDEPEGILEELDRRLSQAKRDFQRTPHEEEKPRIQAEIDDLNKQIETQQKFVDNPKAAAEQTQKNIETGLERERKPEKPTAAETTTKFINPPPGVAPNHYQDRYLEEVEVVRFLNDDSQRMMTIVGRGGVGKTAMACRLLKGLEAGELPDGLGRMRVEGIVYLSESGSHRVNFANLFYDLCKLLPADAANALDAVYKNPQASTASKMSALSDRFTAGKVVVLLDNVEPLISVETFDIADAELDECLRALLHGAHSALKVILTTRVAPRGLNLCEPGRQRVLTLDSGLEPKYAVEMLREMDVDGKLGLKAGTDELLGRAYERTLGFPRALEALFAILASDRYTTLEELLAMPTPVNVVEALVGEAFNRLDANAQKVMQALAVYNRPVTPAAVDYLLAPHIPAMDSAPILQRLANMHFARKESGRFYLHPVDREFAFGLIPQENRDWRLEISDSDESQETDSQSPITNCQSPFTQHELTSRAADYFRKARKPRAEWKKLEDLSAQLAEFDLRCEAGDYDTACGILSSFYYDYLYLWGHYRLWISLHLRVKDNLQDKTLIMHNLNGLGLAHWNIGNIKDAISFYEAGLHAAQEEKKRGWEGTFLGNLGLTYSALGDMHNAIDFEEKALVILQEIGDRRGEGILRSNLGTPYELTGDVHKAIESYEQALVIHKEMNYHRGVGDVLGNLGNAYHSLGDSNKAIEFDEQALMIAHEIGERSTESINHENIGHALSSLGEYQKADKYYETAIQIADEISFPQTQNYARCGLAESFLFQNDLVNARATIEAALGYDVPRNNHNVSALHGIIALRQGEAVTARAAFLRAIGQADEILSKTAEYYSALDAKGLSICGLLICDASTSSAQVLRLGRNVGAGLPGKTGNLSDGEVLQDMTKVSEERPARTAEAIETFQKARKIAPHAGVVKSVLRLFDELVKCDSNAILNGVREIIEMHEA
ncbi:MAG: tetratricopeptide repeat protein [Chloroflexota bacterium]